VADHNQIWLEPDCAEKSYEGRSWCEHDAWNGKCDECDSTPTRYVRADIHDALAARLAEAERLLRRALNQSARVHADFATDIEKWLGTADSAGGVY
jgi:hypothetical protein